MTKRILITAISILLILVTLVVAFATQSPIQEVEISTDPQIVKLSIDYVETDDIEELKELSQVCLDMMAEAHQMAESARVLGYPEESVVISEASAIWWGYHDCYISYILKIRDLEEQIKLAEIEKINKYSEYPIAGVIWEYLRNELGYNEYVSAGIMGNIMVECGGFTLAIQPELYSYGSGYYYGICQWNKGAYPEVRGQDLDYQLNYLANTVEYEINTYGYMYARGHNYNTFINMTDARDAALMFAKSYERCGSSTYNLRQNCAETALEYFRGLS